MVLRGLFRGDGDRSRERDPEREEVPRPSPASEETESVRRIAAEIAALPIEERRFIAGFAYVLARAAHADLEISDEEQAFMEREIVEVGHLSEGQAVLVVEMARHVNELYGATDDYVVTRELANDSTREQREDLLRTAFALAAGDSISAAESAELNQIGKELGFRSDEVDAIRDEFRDHLAAIQAMRGTQGEP